MSNLVDHELERLRRERDEARKQLGQVLYLTKAPSTQALVDGYLEAGRLREALVDARELISRWEQSFGWIVQATWELSEAKSIAEHSLAEMKCEHAWGPLPDWDDDAEPWEQCSSCKANRPQREALYAAFAALAPAPGPAGERQGG